MALTKRGAIWWFSFQHNGKRYQGSTSKEDRAEAEIVQDEAKKSVGKGLRPYRRKEMQEPGVYCLLSRATGLVKVGCSGNMSFRIEQYVTANPEKLQLLAKIPAIDYLEAEKTFHEFLYPFIVRGEWYRITNAHVEAAIGYWITGHRIFGNPYKFAQRVEDIQDLDSLPEGTVGAEASS